MSKRTRAGKSGTGKHLMRNAVAPAERRGGFNLRGQQMSVPDSSPSYFAQDPQRVLDFLNKVFDEQRGIDFDTLSALRTDQVKEAIAGFSDAKLRAFIRRGVMEDPVRFAKLMVHTELSDVLWSPDYKAMDFDQRTKWHDKTVLGHVYGVTDYVHSVMPDNFELKMAALLHDIGKPQSAVPNKYGGLSYPKHDQKSYDMAEKILTKLNYDKGTKGKVLGLIRNHMFDYQWYQPDWNDAQVARWIRGLAKTEKDFDELMAHRLGDTKAQNPEYTAESIKAHEAMVERIKGLGVERILSTKPVVNGNDLMNIFNQAPGKWIDSVKEHVLDQQLLGKVKDKKEALNYLRGFTVDKDGNLKKK